MDCAEEVSLLRRELARRPGIRDLAFDVMAGKMTVEFDAAKLTASAIGDAVAGTGMRAEPWSDRAAVLQQAWWERNGRSTLAWISGLSAAGATILHGFEEGDLIRSLLVHESHHHLSAPVLGLAISAIVFGLAPSAAKTWHAIKSFRPDMNVLVAISVAGAAWLNEWIEGATLSFLFALANLLESWSLERARRAVGSLVESAPREAKVVHGDHEHRTPVELVQVGSVVRVRPGERVPFDGEVVAGESDVNQALITGESVPVPKETGSAVYAGTMNTSGVLDVRTTRPAADTTLARMVRMVNAPGSRRASSEQFVEKFARVYTPAMIALAAAIAVIPPLAAGGDWSRWFYMGMLTLLISCPCALVISTPVSIVAALASAARKGVLIKGGAFLETAAKLNAMAFDKTGVLTAGELDVSRFTVLDGRSEHDALARILALEQPSEHPVAQAIVRYARSRGAAAAAAQQFRAMPGFGAEAVADGATIWAGGTRMLRERGVELETVAAFLPKADDAGHLTIYYGSGGRVEAVLRLDDRVRSEAAGVVEQLHALNVRPVVMLTGDSRETARSVAETAGVDAFHAELLPEDKAAHVEALRSEHGVIAMTGDGVNDALAMSAASAGIALGRRGADVALETADIVLMADDLTRLPFLIRHARRTLAVIHQNVAFALASKAVFLVLAWLGLATLWMAVAADMGATLIVTFNGLRLLRARD